MGKKKGNPDLVSEKDGYFTKLYSSFDVFVFTCSLMSISHGAMGWAVICA